MLRGFRHFDKNRMIEPNAALPGREEVMKTAETHSYFGTPLKHELAEHEAEVVVGLGCFWGAERKFWLLDGVVSTAVGYAAGFTPNPTYDEVCSGQTGHNEVVRVVFDTRVLSLETVLAEFWQAHNPTQGLRQGNDVGSQYRSGIYVLSEQDKQVADASLEHYQAQLTAARLPKITTEILMLSRFYYAEAYHQQYLIKVPNGYCGLGGTGVCY